MVFTHSALVGARQRWWAMIQVVIQLSQHARGRFEMKRRNVRYGLVSICAAGAQASAMILERDV